MTKPFLILQLRPETEAADDEFHAMLRHGGLVEKDVMRIRLDQVNVPPDLDVRDYAGVIVGGGPGCVSDAPEDKDPTEARIERQILALMPQITQRDHPFLGCCYGIGVLAQHLGAEVGKGRYGEPVGPVTCALTEAGRMDPILSNMPDQFDVLVGHKEALHELPDGCVHLLQSAPCPYQMIRYGQNVYATQFHPESSGENFALRIRVYGDKGYFDPSEADTLTQRSLSANVSASNRVLGAFVEKYR